MVGGKRPSELSAAATAARDQLHLGDDLPWVVEHELGGGDRTLELVDGAIGEHDSSAGGARRGVGE